MRKLPEKNQFNKNNNQNNFNKKIKPKMLLVKDSNYSRRNYFTKNNNNITYENSKIPIENFGLTKDFNQSQNFGISDRNPKDQMQFEGNHNYNFSDIYKNTKKIEYDIKIQNNKILDNLVQNQNYIKISNKNSLPRTKSTFNNNHNKINKTNPNEKRIIRANSGLNNGNNKAKNNNNKNLCKYTNIINNIILSQEEPQSQKKTFFNIFKTLLKMINNISEINNYFSNLQNKSIIENTIAVYKNSLTHILYLINNNLSSDDELVKFVDNFIKKFYMNKKTEIFDMKCLKSIINYIYNVINNELTKVKLTNTDIDGQFLNNPFYEFMNKHNSIISDFFMGFFQKEVKCQVNQEITYTKEIFYVIEFDLKDIYYFSADLNILINNYDNPIVNVDYCFNYYFNKDNKNKKISYCDSCFIETEKSEKKYIYSPPNIITIALSNSDNYNLTLQKEINISKFITDEYKHLFSGIYDLILTLYMTRNEKKFIIHSESNRDFNQSNENYSNEIPIMLLYQMRQYPDDIKLTIKFQNGFPQKVETFNKNNKIVEVKQKISNKFKFDINKFCLLINGNRTEDFETLTKYLRDINDVLVIFKERN